VIVMIALQAHGVINTQHRIDHALQFPGVAYAETASVDHDHAEDHDHGHDHESFDPEPLSTDIAEAVDVADTGGDSPINHHHHSGGDIHVALAAPTHPAQAVISAAARLGPMDSLTPPGLSGDGPSHPPKQQRLIA
jgi:hypothetical protein